VAVTLALVAASWDGPSSVIPYASDASGSSPVSYRQDQPLAACDLHGVSLDDYSINVMNCDHASGKRKNMNMRLHGRKTD
jgi:hypothetical protein